MPEAKPVSALRCSVEWGLYRLALLLILPVIPLRLLWRGLRERGYWRHWGERLACFPHPDPDGTSSQSTKLASEQVDGYLPKGEGGAGSLRETHSEPSARPRTQPSPRPSPKGRGGLWVHAVSVGETRAAAPLIAALRARHPDLPILLTCMTVTGRATAQDLYGDFAQIRYLPYDYAWLMRRFLARWQPRVGVLMETELWPNLIREAARIQLPLVLANARLSERSARGYAWLPALTRDSLARFQVVAAQTEADAQRLSQLGAQHVAVTGSLKFDIDAPTAQLQAGRTWRRVWGATRPVLLAASTREGEEAAILAAFAASVPADVLLVLVPRHPQRCDGVAKLIHAAGLNFFRRSQLGDDSLSADVRVILGDSLGELYAYYAACDVAFIGGSLLPLGGQNLIEAASVGRPVLIGPHTFNFAEAAALAIEMGAARRVKDAEELMTVAMNLLTDAASREAMGNAGRTFAARYRGATGRLVALIEPLLDNDPLRPSPPHPARPPQPEN